MAIGVAALAFVVAPTAVGGAATPVDSKLATRGTAQPETTAPLARGGALRRELEEALARTLDYWVARQRADGTFPDPFRPWCPRRCGGYDEAILGYALLAHGLRSGYEPWIAAGVRALRAVLAVPAPNDGVFEPFALASSYRLLTDWGAEQRTGTSGGGGTMERELVSLAGSLRDRLRHLRPLYVRGSGRPWNKPFVEAVAALVIARSDVAGYGPKGTFAGDAAELVPIAFDYLVRRSRELADRSATATPTGTAAVVSDPPYYPAAYHALTTAFLARAREMLGGLPVPDRVRSIPALDGTIRQAVRALAYLAAPDGDIAWRGRSQEQSWALVFAAFAAARQGGACGQKLAALVIKRLLARHRRADGTLAITPAVASDVTEARAYDLPADLGLDWYVSEPAYSGLTLTAGAWLLDALDRAGTPSADRGRRVVSCRLPSEREGAWLVGRGRAAVAVARGREDWVAFGARSAGDLRVDVGLLAWKHRDRRGHWRDAIPLRPIGAGSGGPLLLRAGRAAAGELAWLRWRRDGRILVGSVCFREQPGLPGLAGASSEGGAAPAADSGAHTAASERAQGCLWRRRVTVRVGGGRVSVAFSARGGDVLVQDVFIPGVARIERDRTGLRLGRMRVTATGLVAAAIVPGRYASAVDRGLRRVRLVLRAPRTRSVHLRFALP